MTEMVCAILGVVGTTCFVFGMAGLWQSVYAGGGMMWAIACLAAAVACWFAAWLVWVSRPRPKPITPRHTVSRARQRRRIE